MAAPYRPRGVEIRPTNTRFSGIRESNNASLQVQNTNYNVPVRGSSYDMQRIRFQGQSKGIQSNFDIETGTSSFHPQISSTRVDSTMTPKVIPGILELQAPSLAFPGAVQSHESDSYNQTAIQPMNQNMQQTALMKQHIQVDQSFQDSNFQAHGINRPLEVQSRALNPNRDQTQRPDQGIQRMKQEDVNWLDQWLAPIKARCHITRNKALLQLSEVQMKTRQMLVLIAKLQKQRQILETLRNEDKAIWEQKVIEIEKVKVELDQVKGYLNNEETMAELQKKIQQRKRKRYVKTLRMVCDEKGERMKRHRQAEYEERCQVLERREQIHKQIDTSMEKVRQNEKAIKQEKDLQKEVDEIMSQVKKKLTENNRTMQLLQGLHKLRLMRQERQHRQGVHSSSIASAQIFDTKMQGLQTLLEKQEQIYRTEESALKVILETEQEETREKEREKERQKEVERQKKEEIKVEQALFGSFKDPRPDDPLFPFKQYYDAANQSFDAFLNIRHEWDKYLVLEGTPGGSRIPDQWVLPPEPSSDVWVSALHTG